MKTPKKSSKSIKETESQISKKADEYAIEEIKKKIAENQSAINEVLDKTKGTGKGNSTNFEE